MHAVSEMLGLESDFVIVSIWMVIEAWRENEITRAVILNLGCTLELL